MKYLSLSLLCVFVLGACACCKGSSAPAKEAKPEKAAPPAPTKVVMLVGPNVYAGWVTLDSEINALSSQDGGALHR